MDSNHAVATSLLDEERLHGGNIDITEREKALDTCDSIHAVR